MTSWPSTLTRIPRLERHIDPESAKRATISQDDLVSVIVTTYNSASTVSRALQSVAEQDHENIEVIVVDDCSTDTTAAIVQEFCAEDSRFHFVPQSLNRGTYWAKNVGILRARGAAITFMDSDDYSLRNRISEQLSALAEDGKVASLCNCIRVNEHGEVVLNRGLRERIAPISLMIKQQVLSDVGFFDTVRTSADVEFQGRIALTYGKDALAVVAKPLYEALVFESSLTNAAGNGVKLDTKTSFLSPARQRYSDNYHEWHETLKREGVTARMPFPLTNRPFQVDAPLKVKPGRFDGDPVFAFMATFPPRVEALARSVDSLINQVDHLYIYLNGYDHVPEFLSDERITALPARDLEDLRDVGKTYHMSQTSGGYYFTVDDDIIYPPNYCEVMVRTIEQYDRDAVVGVHGVLFEQPFTRYFSKKRTVYHFRRKLEQDDFVNLLGTGTIAFHSSTIRLDHSSMPKGMLDIGLAVAARQVGVPLVALARGDAWLQPIDPGEDASFNLYEEFKDDDSEHNRLLKAIDDWTPLRRRSDASVPPYIPKIHYVRSHPRIAALRMEIEALERDRTLRIASR